MFAAPRGTAPPGPVTETFVNFGSTPSLNSSRISLAEATVPPTAGRWYYRGTEPMRRVHFAVEHRIGRFVTRRWLKTRISPQGWKLVPVPPAEAAAQISPVPLLIVHGDQDHYFPPEHARQLYMAASEPKELWLIPGMGHAESSCSQALVDRISHWVEQATAQAGRTASVRDEAGALFRSRRTPNVTA